MRETVTELTNILGEGKLTNLESPSAGCAATRNARCLAVRLSLGGHVASAEILKLPVLATVDLGSQFVHEVFPGGTVRLAATPSPTV